MATDNLLAEAMDASQVFMKLTSTNDFPQFGVCQIGSELIKYVVSTDNGLAGLIRGYNSTSAATHAVSAPVLFIEDKQSAGDALHLTFNVVSISGAGAPVDGTSGDGAGFADIGSLYTRRDTGKLYVNGGTKASPTWKLVTSAA